MNNLKRLIIRSKPRKPTSLNSLNECINLIKKRDYENYLCTLLMNDNELKRFAIALRAFNAEIANIKESTKTKDVAQFRFQYWMQTIDKLFIKDYYPPANEPITSELKKVILEQILERILEQILEQILERILEQTLEQILNHF